jgi:surfeit locus 1 family protein
MRRVPILATLLVLIAVLTMVGLGLWQIQRAHWKETLLAQYRAAAGEPPLYGLPEGPGVDAVAFRRSHILCTIAPAPLQIGGANQAGQPGFRNITGCRLIDGRTMMVDLGWSPVSAKPVLPPVGSRVEAMGVLIPDAVLAGRVLGAKTAKPLPLLVVMEAPVTGLQPSIPPSVEDIPNNHRAYAVQWFIFALTALVIYAIALRRRLR